LTVWSLLYISDYALTISCARFYRKGANKKFVFEGSYELTPLFQQDIDSLRLVSPRFLGMLLWGVVLLTIVWLLAAQTFLQFYYFALGSMILIQLAVHTRHLRNLFVFRAIIDPDLVRGRIEYSRVFLLRMSATELITFSGVFFLLFVFTQDWFMLGGAASCLSTAEKHRRLVHKLSSSAVGSAQPQRGT
jgi:hypothetical protein